MQIICFSIFDAKAAYFNTPFYYAHRGQAIRAAMDLGSDLGTTVGRYPADFHLYEIGSFDDQTGAFTAIAPLSLGVIQSFLTPTGT